MKNLTCLNVTLAAALLAAAASNSLAGDSTPPPALPPNHPAVDFSPAPIPVWSPPAHWTVAPASPMVVKSFSIAGEVGRTARVAVSAFPGEVGGLFSNVNRWRAQLGLPPIEQNALAGVTQSLDVAGGKATLVDLTNPEAKPPRLVAVIVPHGASTWFYKLTGDAALVEQEKAAFVKFVQTVTYSKP